MEKAKDITKNPRESAKKLSTQRRSFKTVQARRNSNMPGDSKRDNSDDESSMQSNLDVHDLPTALLLASRTLKDLKNIRGSAQDVISSAQN